MPTALVIGASRGIGREFVRQLLSARWKVFATARDDETLAALRSEGATPIKLDVANAESQAALAWQIDGERIDLAIYSAGVFGTQKGALVIPGTSDFDQVMHTNVLGAMQVIPTVAPLVEAARGKFVLLSSELGSIGVADSGGHWMYRASKAALNMTVKAAAFDYPNAILVAMCPGWVSTDMGGPNAPLTAQQSVGDMRKVIDGLIASDSGTYRNHAGRTLAW